MGDILGGFELRVLSAMLRLGSEAYSVPIVLELERHSGRSTGPAAVYVTLRRLERRGLLTSRLAPPPDGERGRDRRVFCVTPEGIAKVRASRRVLDSLWSGVEALEEA